VEKSKEAMIYLITGKAGAGKTWYATQLKKEFTQEGKSVYHIDGDVWREKNINEDFSDEGRLSNLVSAAKMAGRYEDQNDIVILSFIAPKKEWRELMRVFWEQSRTIYIPGGSLWSGTEYEKPDELEMELRG